MHREFSFHSPGLFLAELQNWNEERNYREEQVPRSIQAFLPEGCAVTSKRVQPYLLKTRIIAGSGARG